MTMLASQITSLTVVYSIVYSGINQRKHQSSASLAFVREIHRGPVNFPHKWPVTRKMFPFDDVIMFTYIFPMVVKRSVVWDSFRGVVSTRACQSRWWYAARARSCSLIWGPHKDTISAYQADKGELSCGMLMELSSHREYPCFFRICV